MPSPTPSGATNSRPLRDSLAQSGPGIPDDSGPPDLDVEALADKLRREADRFLSSRPREGEDLQLRF